MPSFLKNPVQAPLVLLAGTLAVIAGFLFFQYGMDLPPCKLCNWQRVPYYLGGWAFFIAWLFHQQDGKPTKIGQGLVLVAGIAFLIGAGIAVYHVGVENKWWAGPDSCTGGVLAGGDIQQAVKQLMDAPVVRCDEVVWSLFGVSMAGYNVFLSLALGVGALISASYMKVKWGKDD